MERVTKVIMCFINGDGATLQANPSSLIYTNEESIDQKIIISDQSYYWIKFPYSGMIRCEVYYEKENN